MKVVLSYGMGVDSSAILARWLREPESRDFDLDDLIVLTSQVGDEFASTARLIEDHMLDLMRANKVRWVQIARKTASQRDGIEVLSDSRETKKVHLDGCYKLSTELMDAGTIPTSGMCRKCSLKAKGWALDLWIEANVEGEFRHVMGFNADELKRVEKDESYSKVERKSEYPLVTWGWGRKKCEDYLEDWAGERWEKSCCGYCPFAGQNKGGRDELLRRFKDEPDKAYQALRMEQAALALNDRMKLYKSKSVRSAVESNAKRAVEVRDTGSKDEMRAALVCWADGAEVVEGDGGTLKLVVSTKSAKTFPCREECWVAAPHVAKTKVNGKESNAKGLPTGFYKYWPLAEVVVDEA
jgi:hypothetical protein